MLLVLAVAVALATGRGPGRRAVDRAILVALALVAITVVVGAPLPVTGAPPRDPLHFLYALVALAGLPIARVAAADADPRRLGRFVALAALLVLGAMVRLFMTGR